MSDAVSRSQRLIRWAGTKTWFATLARHVVTPIDRRLSNRSSSLTTWVTDLPVGYLTTMGRSTGLPRTVPLVFVVPAEGVAAVVGTNFGGDHHPQWVANLEAEPRAMWKVESEIAVLATKVPPEVHETLWPEFVAMWPGYEAYVRRSQRQPRMFVLEAE